MAAAPVINSAGEPGDLLADFTQYWAEGHRLIQQIWSRYPLLASLDARLGRMYSDHCLASLAVAQAYEIGAASPADLQQTVITFNHLTDQVEQVIGEAFAVLCNYADAVVAQLPLGQKDLGDLVNQQMLGIKIAIKEPRFQSVDGVHILFQKIDDILVAAEAVLKTTHDAPLEADDSACVGVEVRHD